MTFKKYSIKSHYKVNKLVQIKKLTFSKIQVKFQTQIKPQKYFTKLAVILNSKRQNLGLMKPSSLKVMLKSLIKLVLFRFRT